MKRLIIIALALTISGHTFAQQAHSNAAANSQQLAAVTDNSHTSLTLDTNSSADGAAHYSGTAHILSNPGAPLGGAAAGFSNNNCANTGQKALSALVASGATSDPIESKPCNYRQNAATFYAAAAVRAANGQSARAEALMAMGDVAACRAAAAIDATDMDNCRALGIVGDRDAAKTFEPSTQPSQPPPHPVKPADKGYFPTTQAGDAKKVDVIAVAHP